MTIVVTQGLYCAISFFILYDIEQHKSMACRQRVSKEKPFRLFLNDIISGLELLYNITVPCFRLDHSLVNYTSSVLFSQE